MNTLAWDKQKKKNPLGRGRRSLIGQRPGGSRGVLWHCCRMTRFHDRIMGRCSKSRGRHLLSKSKSQDLGCRADLGVWWRGTQCTADPFATPGASGATEWLGNHASGLCESMVLPCALLVSSDSRKRQWHSDKDWIEPDIVNHRLRDRPAIRTVLVVEQYWEEGPVKGEETQNADVENK